MIRAAPIILVLLLNLKEQYVEVSKPTFIIKFQGKNLNLNRDSNSDLQISRLALYQ